MNTKEIWNNLKFYGRYNTYKELLVDIEIDRGVYNNTIQKNSMSFKVINKIVSFCTIKKLDLNKIFVQEESDETVKYQPQTKQENRIHARA